MLAPDHVRWLSRRPLTRHILAVPDGDDDVNADSRPVESALPLAGQLERFFRRRGHGDDALDLVQELFVLLLSKEAGIVREVPGRFRSFLFAIAYRLGANATRRRQRAAGGPLHAGLASAELDPERAALLAENVRRAVAALNALPEGTRRVLLLVADEGRSIREAAALLGVSEDVVRARLCRGRKRIAGLLKGE
jgi:RNA polymerase sigma-70 factor (ECF subfamily)